MTATEPSTDTAAPVDTAAAQPSAPVEQEQVKRLEVAVRPRSGSALLGKTELTELADGVRVVVRIARAQAGLHAVHIHETADCSAEDASSAGDHLNPEQADHGLPHEAERHLGDLGNMRVTAPDGEGLLEITVPGATLEPGPKSLINRALVIHANDDEGSQPSGQAGKRVGCAELTLEAARQQQLGEVVAEQ